VLPKELLPLIDRPIIQLAVEEAAESGITDVLVVTSRGKELLVDHFDRQPELEDLLRQRGKLAELEAVHEPGRGLRLHYTRQADPLGLGHAVLQAKEHVGREPFAVMLPDDVMLGPRPILAQLLEHYRPGLSVVALMEVPREEASRYGVVSGHRDGRVLHIAKLVEKPPAHLALDPSWAVMGRYILDPDVFSLLESLPPGAGGEIQLTDALDRLARAGRLVGVIYEGERFDMGDKLGYIKAVIDYGLARTDFAADLSRYLRSMADAGRF
jgi:UTP--glucose-1-phosphate uridylyltransferase